jgi:hypothetical protein
VIPLSFLQSLYRAYGYNNITIIDLSCDSQSCAGGACRGGRKAKKVKRSKKILKRNKKPKRSKKIIFYSK